MTFQKLNASRAMSESTKKQYMKGNEMTVYTVYRGVMIYRDGDYLVAYPLSGVKVISKDIIFLTQDINKYLDK